MRDGRWSGSPIAERGGEAVGYALFRRKSSWAEAGPEGTVGVQELVATDPAVAHALWSRLLDLDLTTEVTSGMLADDDPLLSLLVDLRAATSDASRTTSGPGSSTCRQPSPPASTRPASTWCSR